LNDLRSVELLRITLISLQHSSGGSAPSYNPWNFEEQRQDARPIGPAEQPSFGETEHGQARGQDVPLRAETQR
jgi:hypothetical protein